MGADPFLHERMDLLFGMVTSFIVARFRSPDEDVPSLPDFVYEPWAADFWNKQTGAGKQEIAKTLASIFSSMPGVVVTPPKEKS